MTDNPVINIEVTGDVSPELLVAVKAFVTKELLNIAKSVSFGEEINTIIADPRKLKAVNFQIFDEDIQVKIK